MQKLKQFLAKQYLVIKMDHRPLVDVFLSKQEVQNARVQHRFLQLGALDMELYFIKGCHNFSADLLLLTVCPGVEVTAKDSELCDDAKETVAINANRYSINFYRGFCPI